MKVLVTTFLLMIIGRSSTAETNDSCELEETKSIVVHLDWPTVISCDSLIVSYSQKFYISGNLPPKENLTCSVVNPANNETLWSNEIDMSKGFAFHAEDYITEDITRNSTMLYYVFLKSNSSCSYDVISLNVSEHENTNCSLENRRTVEMKGSKGNLRVLTCQVIGHDEPDVHLSDESHNFTVKWYRNCTELKLDDRYRVDGRRLVIKSLDFDMAGTYSCSITYKQKTRFVANIAVCVQPPVYFSYPNMHCPKRVTVKTGQDVELICQVDAGLGPISSFRTNVYWKQDSNSTKNCRQHFSFGNTIAKGWNGRAECALNTSEAQDHYNKCFLYEPSVKDQSAKKNIVKAILVIKNVQTSDFGEYFVRFKTLSHAVNDTVLLVEDVSEDKPYYIHTVIALCIATVVVIVVVSAVVLIKCRKKSSSFKS